MNSIKTSYTKGGAFLIKESTANQIFIPEQLSEEQKMMAAAVEDFIETEVEPLWKKFDSKAGIEIGEKLLEKAGALGFLGIGIPEEYGGNEMDFLTSIAFAEKAFASYSFALTLGVQTSIGIAPIYLYANAEQKARYLPKMVTGKLKGCYCLTEPGSGSDANSCRTQAILNKEGTHYILNGQKMWITNSGFADLFTVFAKIDDDKDLSAFIVEKDFGGISLGEEEQKMGIKGSSTRQVFFNEVPVPIENLLGERGQGFKIALNVLNTGRIKMGAAVVGSTKKAMKYVTQYAIERKQFGQPIASFGAIQHKIGQCIAKLYATESLLYRTAHNIDLAYQEMIDTGKDPLESKWRSIAEFAIECAITKVYSTEAADFMVDEGVQIHGGMGFSAETKIEMTYRDTRINRIYEGTNEINRMLMVDMLFKKALRGKIDILTAAKSVQQELMSIPSFSSNGAATFLHQEKQAVQNFKKVILMTAGAAAQKLMKNLKEEQEILMHIADMLMQTYAFESAVLRTEKLCVLNDNKPKAGTEDILKVLMHEANNTITNAAKEVIYAFAEGDELKAMEMGIKRFTKLAPCNLKNVRRRVAQLSIDHGGYFVN